MRVKTFFRDKKIEIVVFFIVTICAIAPLISKYCIQGHDLEYHLLRIESLKEGILMGKPFLKVNTLFFDNAGYASSMFYPDVLLYIPAILRVMGLSINASYHVFIAVTVILCYLSTYYSVKGMTKSSFGGMISAVAITLCQYHLDDIYIRSAVGEFTAFIFIPIAIYAIYNIVYEKMDKPWLLLIGYGGLLLMHTSSFIMCVAFGIVALLIKIKPIINNKGTILKIVITAAITVLLTSFYWLPMLEQMSKTRFLVSIPWMNPKDEAMNFFKIFGSQFPAMGSMLVVMLIPRIVITKKNNKNLEFTDWLMAAGALFLVFSTDYMPWDRIGKYFSFVQFPWRFLIMSSCLFAVAAGVIFVELAKDMPILGQSQKNESFLLLLVLVIFVIGGIKTMENGSIEYYDYSDDYYSCVDFTAGVIAGEWLPVSVTNKDTILEDVKYMYSDSKEVIDYCRNKNELMATLDSGINYVDVPFIYYYGYTATLVKDDGSVISPKVTGEGNNGLCRVYFDGNSQGKLIVRYSGTLLQIISYCLSLVTFFVIIICWVMAKRKEKLS